MTWAQGTFAYSFGILVPTAGILSAIQLKREGKSAMKGFVLGSGMTFLTLVACCFVAVFVFPHYPRQHVPELMANAFTLPGVVAGIVSIWLVSKAGNQSQRFRVISSIIIAAVYVAGVFVSHQMFTWSFRKELPWSASDIHERYWSDTLLPDYDYRLKARITEDEFQRYISKFDLTPHSTTRQYSDSDMWLDWRASPGLNNDWWNPSGSLTNTFVWQGNDTWIFAKYEQGYLYLGSLNH